MEQIELMKQIIELEREIAMLPEGSITKKKINNKDYYYHRITIDGKRKEIYVRFEELSELNSQINKRKMLEKKLKELKTRLNRDEVFNHRLDIPLAFKTIVRTGKALKKQIAITKNYKKRECFHNLRNYIFEIQQNKVFIIYGLRRTGKTTMIYQVLNEMTDSEFEKAAFIQIRKKDTLTNLDTDLRLLEENGFKYVFIDEVTLMEDFIEGASLFSDIYVSSGMKIVLSGTDSLGFLFSKEEQLYDRCIMLHTTFIPYREFEHVLGIKGIDEYIRFGGTMSISGVNYNKESPFSNSQSTEEYIDTAIAKNIQHSLKMYQYGGHFRHLSDLYERGELTNVINRVVENINHSFARSVVERTFKSHDISLTASNLLKDREKPINIKAHMDLDTLTSGIMQMLDIVNKENQSIDVEDIHMVQIKEYLLLLDLIKEIDLEFLPEVSRNKKAIIITQPGMRYAQASAIIENILLDAKFQELSAKDRQRILNRLLNEIRGRMMEEIILLETKLAHPNKKVFKLQFPIGEYDMVIYDPNTISCEIYEVKYSKEQVSNQYRHLIDYEKCAMTTHRYGDIKGRYVIYRGEKMNVEGIQYLNVEEYLNSL